MRSLPPRQPRWPELDVLRAIAVFLVFGRHILLTPEHPSSWIQKSIIVWKRCGWIGVDLFFVLSGFLVSGLLFREYISQGSVSLSRFLIRRGLKIYPAFFFFLAVGTPLVYYASESAFSWKGLWGEVLFLQNYLGTLWLHTWSLAVEEHFYLFLVCVVLLARSLNGRKRPFDFIPALFLIVGIAAMTGRVYMGYVRHSDWSKTLLPTHFRIDSLLFGVTLSYYYHFYFDNLKKVVTKNRIKIMFGCVLFVLPALFMDLHSSPFLYTYGLTLLYLAFGGFLTLILIWKSDHKAQLLRKLQIVGSIGRHSYSIYLWHVAAYVLSLKLLSQSAFQSFELHVVLYLTLAISIGTLMSMLIEMPLLRFRDHQYPSRVGDQASGTLHYQSP